MTNVQLYFAVGIPTLVVLLGILMNVLLHNGINARFNGVEGRFNSVDARFNGVEARFNSLDAKFDILTGKVIDVDNRLTRIEAKLGIG